MQSDRPRVLERAFVLAGSGVYRTRGEIAKALHREGYSTDELLQLQGPTLLRQLKALCRAGGARSTDRHQAATSRREPDLREGPG